MYAFDFNEGGEQQALAAPKKDASILLLWRARLVHAEHCTMKWMADKDVF